MNVKIIRVSDGQEVDIKHLDKEFAGQFLSNNPFGLMIMATMAILKDALQPTEEVSEKALDVAPDQEVYQDREQPNLVLDVKELAPKEDLFAEEAQCTGNPGDCPICGNQEEGFSFSEALEILRNGGKVTRKEWFDLDVDYLFLFEGSETAYPAFLLQDSENQKIYPYTFQHDDLLAKDWILIDEEN